MPKSVFGRGSAPDPAGGAHDAPPDPLVGWRGDTPPHIPPHSARTHLWRSPCVPPEVQPDLRLWEAGPFNRMFAVAPSGECLRGESQPDRMLATPWRRLCLAAFGLSLFVAVLRGSVGTSYMCIVAVLRDRLRSWAFCLNCNKRRCWCVRPTGVRWFTV